MRLRKKVQQKALSPELAKYSGWLMKTFFEKPML